MRYATPEVLTLSPLPCWKHLTPEARRRLAADLVASGQFGKMVALRSGEIIAIPLADAVMRQKLVRLDSQLVRTARALGVVMG